MSVLDKSDPDNWVIGDILSYPCSDHKFFVVCTIPFSVGLSWIKMIPFVEGNHPVLNDRTGLWTKKEDYQLGIPEYSFESFHSKLAVIVQIDDYQVIAVYRHDDRFQLIKRKLM